MVNKENIEEYVISIENEHRIKVGDIIVDIDYAKDGKQFNQCMLNILKQKISKKQNNFIK